MACHTARSAYQETAHQQNSYASLLRLRYRSPLIAGVVSYDRGSRFSWFQRTSYTVFSFVMVRNATDQSGPIKRQEQAKEVDFMPVKLSKQLFDCIEGPIVQPFHGFSAQHTQVSAQPIQDPMGPQLNTLYTVQYKQKEVDFMPIRFTTGGIPWIFGPAHSSFGPAHSRSYGASVEHTLYGSVQAKRGRFYARMVHYRRHSMDFRPSTLKFRPSPFKILWGLSWTHLIRFTTGRKQ